MEDEGRDRDGRRWGRWKWKIEEVVMMEAQCGQLASVGLIGGSGPLLPAATWRTLSGGE